MLLTTVKKTQEQIAINSRLQRLNMNLTQQGLSERSGVPLATLRKFEQKKHNLIRVVFKAANGIKWFRKDR